VLTTYYVGYPQRTNQNKSKYTDCPSKSEILRVNMSRPTISRTNPTNGISFCATAGNMVLPHVVPMEVNDKARPRFLENQCDTMTSAGLNMKPQDNPTPRPCTRKKCQYCVHCEVRKVHARRTQLAAKHGSLKYPRSNSRPAAIAGRYMNAY